MARLAIDPVTRVGGHLRIEVEVVNGAVRDAWSSGTMFRGFERIIEGRDPRDAWLVAERICGTCTGVHALASVRAVEAALGLSIPRNARLLRNLLAGTQAVIDHVVHFYVLHAPDWVDFASAATADPGAAASLADSFDGTTSANAAYFRVARDRLARTMSTAPSGPLGGGYWGHPAYRLSPAANLVVFGHYVEALEWLRTVTRIQALLGGKSPHPQSWLVGGMTLAPSWGGPTGSPAEHPQVDHTVPAALSSRGLADLADLLARAKAFVDTVYVPDVLAIARQYADWAGIGAGVGNFLSAGEYPEDDTAKPALLLPAGRLMGRNLAAAQPVDQANIAEAIAHSHYVDEGGDATGRHPATGETTAAYGGPALPFTTLEGADRYSWLKAPRYREEPMEVGPLARMLVGYGQGSRTIRAGIDGAVSKLGIGRPALLGTLGRTIARALETQLIAAQLERWLAELRDNIASGDLALAELSRWEPASWPRTAEGWSLGEGPRGAVGHWVRIRDDRIDRYQVVDATTWNASPRDGAGRRGPLEEALIGTPVADPARPVEILRTVHSFDPCLACAAHTIGRPDVEIRVV